MTYAYFFLLASSVVAALCVGFVLFKLSRPEQPLTLGPDDHYSVTFVTMERGGRLYSVDSVKPSTASRCLLAVCTALFLGSVIYLLLGASKRTHTGTEFPVERLAEHLAGFVEDERPVLVGGASTQDEPVPDVALSLEVTGSGWQIDVTASPSDLTASLAAPTGPFSHWEEVNSYENQYRTIRVTSTDPVSDCIWFFRDYFKYPDGQKLSLSVMDGESYTWRPSRVAKEGN